LQYAETTLEKSCIYNVQLMYSSLLFLCMNGVVSPIKKENIKQTLVIQTVEPCL